MTTDSHYSVTRIVTLLVTVACLQLLHQPQLCHGEVKSQKSWYLPTRLTARIPCLDETMLQPGRTLDQEHSTSALYRWVQANGNIMGSRFYQAVRLLRLPDNHREPFFVVSLVCMLYDWNTDATVVSSHEINFYEGPTLTAAVTVGFRSRQNFTDFVQYLGRISFANDWCLRNERCIQALVAPVRSPELEYPHLFDSAGAFNRTPLTDLLGDLRIAAVTGLAPDFIFYVNFVLRISLSSRLVDLCNPILPKCSRQLLSDRQGIVMQFSEATVQALDRFTEERATIRKLMTNDQSLVEIPADAINFTLRLNSMSVCLPGYGPANLTSLRVDAIHKHNGTALLCMACPPGTHGSNGLNCFPVPNDYYTEEWGGIYMTPCPDYYVTLDAGASTKSRCTFNGTTPERIVMVAMRLAWQEIEMVFYESKPGIATVALLLYLFVTAYALSWQLHRLVKLMQYKRRRGMSDRLLKRFIAEAYLRDLRRRQYWESAMLAAEAKAHKERDVNA